MTSAPSTGQKRPRSETPAEDASLTPQAKRRIAAIEAFESGLPPSQPATPSSAISAAQRKKRFEGLQQGVRSASATPTGPRHDSKKGDSLQEPHGHSLKDAFINAQNEDDEDDLWAATDAVERPPRGGPSAAGYHPNTSSTMRSADWTRSPMSGRSSMPTPPRSSPFREDSPAPSTAAVSELLRGSPDPSQHRTPTGRTGAPEYPRMQEDPDNPFHVRPSAAREATNTRATPGPSTPSKHGIAESMRAHLSELERIPDTIEKLERKYKAAEQSALKKQERIHQLEAQVLKLQSKCKVLEETVSSLETRRR